MLISSMKSTRFGPTSISPAQPPSSQCQPPGYFPFGELCNTRCQVASLSSNLLCYAFRAKPNDTCRVQQSSGACTRTYTSGAVTRLLPIKQSPYLLVLLWVLRSSGYMHKDMHTTGSDTPVVTRFFWPPLTPRRMALPIMVSAQMSSPNTSIMACKRAKQNCL